ncbi:MAG: glycosyltransferase family 4 protein [Christensenellaceae bacterium]
MRVVIVTPILFEQTSPFNHIMKDILEGLITSGIDITRIVAVEDRTEAGYTLGISSDRISYIVIPRKRSEHDNIVRRYLSDTFVNVKMSRIIGKQKADVLFEDVSYSSFWSVRKAKAQGLRVVSMLQDVWPDNAVQSGLITDNGLVYRFFEMLQKTVYRKSDRLICISDDMKNYITSKGVENDKIDVVYNWGYTDGLVNVDWNKNRFVQKYNLCREKFYAVYAGNIGRMQNVELIIEAAQILKDQDDICFLIIGDGAKKREIVKMVSEKHLKNVNIIPHQSSDMAMDIYSVAGVNLIPLVNGGCSVAMPSKTGVCLSCGKPIITCFNTDSSFAHVITNARAGLNAKPDDKYDLAAKIIEIAEKFNEFRGGHDVYLRLFQKDHNVSKYSRIVGEWKNETVED